MPETAGVDAVLALAGELDVAVAPCLRERLLNAINAEAHAVVVDLGGVTLLDACCLGLIVGAHARARHHGIALTVRGARGVVQRVLDLTGPSHELGAAGSLDPPTIVDLRPRQRA